MESMFSFSTIGRALGTVGDVFGQAKPPTGCPQADPDALFKKLTAIKVAGVQVIKDEDARGVSDELTATVRCNAFEAAGAGARQEAKKVIIPIAAIVIVGALVSIAGAVAAGSAARRSSRVARRAAGYTDFGLP
jgi:hypothetical protein